MNEVKQEAARREVAFLTVPTREAIQTLQAEPEDTNAILHVTRRFAGPWGVAGRNLGGPGVVAFPPEQQLGGGKVTTDVLVPASAPR
jgi:hypothetical protein